MIITRAEYRKLLNARDANSRQSLHKNGKYQQRTRLYGDYLWHQDRDRFEVEYSDFVKNA